MGCLKLGLTLIFLSYNLNSFYCCPEPYQNCNLGKEGYINVHLVPHTHDDVGWLKTVDQYYYGSNSLEFKAGVQYIIDTVIQELDANPERRFVYVEIAYFWRWWNEQNNNTKQLVRKLVDEHRLEFVIGAWCMNDEATTYYNDIIDQQTLGLKFILKEFGECARPRSAWQVDPFGHSREQASLFAQFGFDGLFLGRIDYQDLEKRSLLKNREMLWEASQSLDPKYSSLFTGVLPNVYTPPPGFCFDYERCDDDPIMDDPEMEGYNVKEKVKRFIQYVIDERQIYKTDNLIMTMGSDFQYSNANSWFVNLDKLIRYVNLEQEKSGSKINIFYSTTACYLYSLYRSNQTWPVKTDDFFPYANRDHSYWTGYFTSRAALKYYVRQTNSFLQSSRHLIALSDLNDNQTRDALGTLERAMGVAQHHDAVSGTERQHVANDYSKRLASGINKLVKVFPKTISETLQKHFGENYKFTDLDLIYCSLLNISDCTPIDGKQNFSIIIYNPLPRPIKHYFQIPVAFNDYQLIDLQSTDIILADYVTIDAETKKIPERKSKANYSMVFSIELTPVGYKVLFAQRTQKRSIINKTLQKSTDLFTISNKYSKLTFDSDGNLQNLDNLESSISTKLNQYFCVYESMPGLNIESKLQASGAYIFRPLRQSCEKQSVKNYTIVKGRIFTEIHQIYNEWLSQSIRLYNDSRDIEFGWQVGPVDVSNYFGKEIVIKFDSDLNSESLFYTDSNGREILQRKRDYRPTWNLRNTEKISGNYYPINSRIFLRDEGSQSKIKRQLTLITDRSEGGSSIQDGSMEIMLHRRILFDDGLGVTEPLNEHGSNGQGLIVKGITRLIFDNTTISARLHRELAHRVNYKPLVLFANSASLTHIKGFKKLSGISAISNNLPSNLHLLTLMKEFDSQQPTMLVRIEHFYEANEDPILSKPIEINLQQVFSDMFTINKVEELALGANMKVEELENRLKWNSENKSHNEQNKLKMNYFSSSDFIFSFSPMQIRTFRLYLG